MKVQLTENTYFGYSREIEYVAALAGILGDNLDGRACREVFGEEFVVKFRKKHRELAEINYLLALSITAPALFQKAAWLLKHFWMYHHKSVHLVFSSLSSS